MFKRTISIITVGILLLGLCGCEKSPDKSIVANKDMDNLIDSAQNTEGEIVEIEDLANYDSYVTSFRDEGLRVQVDVDAKVDIPQTSQMSVLRVTTKDISNEMVDKLRSILMSNEALYDGAALGILTKEDIEKEIAMIKEAMVDMEEEVLIEEYQRYIDEYEVKYETALNEVDITDYPLSGQMYSANENTNPDLGDYYEWQVSLNPGGTIINAITDGSNGFYQSIYAQNNSNYGNCLRYRKTNSETGYNTAGSIVVEGNDFSENNADSPYWKKGEPISSMYVVTEMSECTKESATISEAEAREVADQFIGEMDLGNFEYYEGGLYCEAINVNDNPEFLYRNIYIFRYMRNIDGAFVLFHSGGKFADGWNDDDYYKKMWGCETVEIRVNDNGVVGVNIEAPLEIIETVVDKSSMKSFEEIKDIFEKMVVVQYADEEAESTIKIDRVRLGYIRISEEDSFDTGLLVPVWEFYGSYSFGFYTGRGSVMTINAIDGTVIDKTLGY